jgi:hypothetical protein
MTRATTSKPRRQRTFSNEAASRRNRLQFAPPSRKVPLKILVSVEPEDLEWLDVTVGTLKGTRRSTTKSEIVRAGLKLLMEKRPDELKELIRHLY